MNKTTEQLTRIKVDAGELKEYLADEKRFTTLDIFHFEFDSPHFDGLGSERREDLREGFSDWTMTYDIYELNNLWELVDTSLRSDGMNSELKGIMRAVESTSFNVVQINGYCDGLIGYTTDDVILELTDFLGGRDEIDLVD